MCEENKREKMEEKMKKNKIKTVTEINLNLGKKCIKRNNEKTKIYK